MGTIYTKHINYVLKRYKNVINLLTSFNSRPVNCLLFIENGLEHRPNYIERKQ